VPNLPDLLANHFRIPSPIEERSLPACSSSVVRVKREDRIHQDISGNKWRKLSGYLEKANNRGIITMGGPFSNHLHATAAACHFLGRSLVCLVRGEDADVKNPTLTDIGSWGARIIPLDRATYRKIRSERSLPKPIRDAYPDYLFIPEGGLGSPALSGIEQLAKEIYQQLEGWPQCIVLPLGTGTSAYGLRQFAPSSTRILGIRTVLDQRIPRRLKRQFSEVDPQGELEIIEGYEWGGFAKFDSRLLDWMEEVKAAYNLPLDLVYNSKAFFALNDLIASGELPGDGSTLYLHTGGLQGNRSLDYFKSRKRKRS
jgi:1-aminocyclopropane-1-carboxylate deaminase